MVKITKSRSPSQAAKHCESMQNAPNRGTKSGDVKSPTIFTCKYAPKSCFLPLRGKEKSLNFKRIQGLALFCLFLKWYHQESNRGHKDFQYKQLKITIVTLSESYDSFPSYLSVLGNTPGKTKVVGLNKIQRIFVHLSLLSL